MSEPTSADEWSILLSGMADEQLTEEQEGRLLELLRTDDEFRREYVRFCQLQAQLTWHLTQETSAEYAAEHVSSTDSTSSTHRSVLPWLPWIATALIVIIAVSWFGDRKPPKVPFVNEPLARLVNSSGRVKLTRLGREPELIRSDELAQRPEPLQAGDRLLTDSRSLAMLRLADETVIHIRPNSEVVLFPPSSRGIEVSSGSISANVASQKPRDPLTFFTPNSEVQVIGTELEILSLEKRSEVAVMEGTVRVIRRGDKVMTTVSTGQVVTVNASEPLTPRDWPRRPDFWDIDFENGLPPGWQGRFVQDLLPEGSAGAAGSTPLPRNQRVTTQVQSPFESAGLFFWHDDSVLNVTFKVQPPDWFHIDLLARTYHKSQPLLTYCYVDAELWQSRPGEWRTVSIPLSEFRLQTVLRDEPTLGRIPIRLTFRGESESAGFLIDRIWVTRGSEVSPGSDDPLPLSHGARSP
ncbi:MAG: FecR domain-containing protein [Planctomycetaceae bacterium]|nr:FecR domain-containing protein [Planctomycetaceae bacterium]